MPVLFGILVVLLSGCMLAREPSKTPRTAVEQLLLSHAIERSVEDLIVPIPESASVVVDVVGFSTHLPFLRQTKGTHGLERPEGLVFGVPSDLSYVRDAVASRLALLGFRVRSKEDEATYRVNIKLQALGTEQGQTFFGMPPVQSVIIPFALPELTVYKRDDQTAHVRYSLDIYEIETGQLLRSTAWYHGSSYYHMFTILFLIRFKTSDLILPPS